jgi:hypothetical protein
MINNNGEDNDDNNEMFSLVHQNMQVQFPLQDKVIMQRQPVNPSRLKRNMENACFRTLAFQPYKITFFPENVIIYM